MAGNIVCAFLSSTSADLEEARKRVYAELNKRDWIKCRSMDDFSASIKDPRQVSEEAAQWCDLYIGIFGDYYGSEAPNTGKSYTQLEFEAAVSEKKGHSPLSHRRRFFCFIACFAIDGW